MKKLWFPLLVIVVGGCMTIQNDGPPEKKTVSSREIDDELGRTALAWAEIMQRTDTAKLLIDSGAVR